MNVRGDGELSLTKDRLLTRDGDEVNVRNVITQLRHARSSTVRDDGDAEFRCEETNAEDLVDTAQSKGVELNRIDRFCLE